MGCECGLVAELLSPYVENCGQGGVHRPPLASICSAAERWVFPRLGLLWPHQAVPPVAQWPGWHELVPSQPPLASRKAPRLLRLVLDSVGGAGPLFPTPTILLPVLGVCRGVRAPFWEV